MKKYLLLIILGLSINAYAEIEDPDRCKRTPGARADWTNCDKRGIILGHPNDKTPKNLRGMKIDGANFEGAFINAEFGRIGNTRAVLKNVSFKNATFKNTTFDYDEIESVTFESAKIAKNVHNNLGLLYIRANKINDSNFNYISKVDAEFTLFKFMPSPLTPRAPIYLTNLTFKGLNNLKLELYPYLYVVRNNVTFD